MALGRIVRVLLAPADALSERVPSYRTAVGIVLLVGLCSAASLSATGAIFGGVVEGTATVDNPEYPDDGRCDPDNPIEYEACDRPQTKTVQLDAVASDAVSNLAGASLVAILVAWPTLAGGVYVLGVDGEPFDRTFRAVSWSFLPGILVALARPVILYANAGAYPYPSEPEPLREFVRSLAVGFESVPLVAVGAVALLWQAYVLFGALRATQGTPARRSGLAVGGTLLVLGGLVLLEVPYVAGELLLVALVAGGTGVLSLVFTRRSILFDKRLDLIGFANTENVEPKDWFVYLNRVGGFVAFVVAFAILGGPHYLL